MDLLFALGLRPMSGSTYVLPFVLLYFVCTTHLGFRSLSDEIVLIAD